MRKQRTITTLTSSNNTSRKRSKRKSTRQPYNVSLGNHVTYSLPRSRLIAPDSVTVNLSFTDQTNLVVKNSISNIGSVRYRPSGVFDVDPNILSSAVPGFKEWTFFYGKYRLISSSIKVSFSNLEAVPVQVYIWPSNFDLNANYAFAAAAISNPFARSATLSKSGGLDEKTLYKRISTGQIFGTDEVYYDDDYSSATSTIPVNNWFWNVGAWAPGSTFLTNGVQTLTVIELTVQFTERSVITN